MKHLITIVDLFKTFKLLLFQILKYSVLPTLHPMMEDLFLSRERMSDDQKELETQKEVLLNILIRLVQYHKVSLIPSIF